MGRSQDLYRKAKTLIPGGTQLLSKRPEMFLPDNWPSYYSEAKGCEITDLDGKKYTDMTTMGIGSCILGYADDDVNKAVVDVINKGSMSTLNAPEEVELAELLCKLHPWAGMARFSRTGGEAMAIAVRIARAHTKKDKVLFCGYHGWHDWYLAANLSENRALDGHLLPGLSPNGVPRGLKGLTLPFNYNNTEEFVRLFGENKGNVCAVVLEAIRNDDPNKDFISAIREMTAEHGAVFIVDEITSGFRLNLGGAHLLHGYEPDVAVFAKGISNGYPMSAVIGRNEVMQSAQDSFISSTYWTDRIGPAAALATLKKMKEKRVQERLIEIGRTVQEGWATSAGRHGLKVHASGIYPLSHFEFKYDEPLALKTLFTQEMLAKGFLASTQLYASFAHTSSSVNGYLKAVDEVFALISKALKDGDVKKHLKGPVCHSGFKRLN